MVIDRHGNKKSHAFERAMMRSAAKLSYQEAQAAIDGNVSPKCAALMKPVLRPLWEAYAVLASARDKRQPLDLDLPERKIVLDEKGRVARVVVPERLTAHRLIEEFMIQANVAAAEALEGKRAPVVYRTHDQPSKEKLTSLREFLDSLEITLAPQGTLKPEHFNRILQRAKATPIADLINEVVLRSQSQAEYSVDNLGHFGLNLRRYAHFTSPIRRYADLIAHRALIRALRLGAGGLEDFELSRLADVSRSISEAERRAMAAERETADRLIAAHLADRIGAMFSGRIAGVARSGLVRAPCRHGRGRLRARILAAGRFLPSQRGAARARRQAHRRDVQPRRYRRGAARGGDPLGGRAALRDAERGQEAPRRGDARDVSPTEQRPQTRAMNARPRGFWPIDGKARRRKE